MTYSISFLNVRLTEGVPKQVRMAHLACIGKIISIYSFHILINIELLKGVEKSMVLLRYAIFLSSSMSRCSQENSCIANLSVRLS